MSNKEYDVFISHASKDKIKFVDGLVDEIKNTGLSVFYDVDSIAWGDSIKAKIDEGLNGCRRAVVVISKNYFGRKWTEYELKSLFERQVGEGRKLIMPILHGISKAQLLKRYPYLEDIKFQYSRKHSAKYFAELLAKDLSMCD